MTRLKDIQIVTHGDPRACPEYAILHREISKLSHPARPETDWKQTELMCLSLFRRNGLDLQSVLWFTLSLSHQYGAEGLRDGLLVTEALINSCWSSVWPESPAERSRIIQTFVTRVQALLRVWSVSSSLPLSALSECEKSLCRIDSWLKKSDLIITPGPDSLIVMLKNIIVKSGQASETQLSFRRPPHDAESTLLPSSPNYRFIFNRLPEHDSAGAGNKHNQSSFAAFFYGIFSALSLVCILMSTGYYLTHPSESERLLASAMPPLPISLNENEQSLIRKDADIDVARWTNMIRMQTESLDAAGIGRSGDYSAGLALQVARLWPQEKATASLLSEVSSRRQAAVIPAEKAIAWKQGIDKLNALKERLDTLDEKRGRYLTVSELKTAIYSASQTFTLHVPAEEWLRRYESSGNLSEKAQFLRAMDEMQARYDLIRIKEVTTRHNNNLTF